MGKGHQAPQATAKLLVLILLELSHTDIIVGFVTLTLDLEIMIKKMDTQR